MKHTQQQVRIFQQTVWGYYHRSGRDLPWRKPEPDGSFDPYKIIVSEIMLQQTRASRVVPKYREFLTLFPNVKSLAQARLGEVIRAWSGLGYNRRAKHLHQAAQMIADEYKSQFPQTLNALTKLPGVGKNTAGAIMAYAYNQPAVFIETNIRTVYIHHFLDDRVDIADLEISQLVADTLDKNDSRQWYWALMDYGTHLKSLTGNIARKSKQYKKQTIFKGSRRQIRGKVLKLLIAHDYAVNELKLQIADSRTSEVLNDLLKEGLIQQNANGTISLFRSSRQLC